MQMKMASKDVEIYRGIEKWCEEHVQAGSAFLFDSKKFHRTLQITSEEWGFAYEVRNKKSKEMRKFSMHCRVRVCLLTFSGVST